MFSVVSVSLFTGVGSLYDHYLNLFYLRNLPRLVQLDLTTHWPTLHRDRLIDWNLHTLPWSRHSTLGAGPPRCGPGDPLVRSPSTSPMVVGLKTPPWPDPPQLPPWEQAWKPARHAGVTSPLGRPATRHAGMPPARHAGILHHNPPTPPEQNHR